METLLQDLRFAARTLRKSPGFTALAVVCLALGIGVNATMFSVVDEMLIAPFPFRDSERLVGVHNILLKNNDNDAGLSYLNFRDWQAQASAFEQMAAFGQRSITFNDGDEPERVEGGTITWNLFPMLGISPILGRGFREDEDRVGGDQVVLLSHELWSRRFNSDPSIIGRSVQVNASPHTVVGVMPARFKFPDNQEAWLPHTQFERQTFRAGHYLGVMARLKDGVTFEKAQAEAVAIGKRLAEAYPEENGAWGGGLQTLRKELIPDDVKLIVLTMMGAVTFVLLIACANVANLMLARASARGREIAIRTALGAGRWRIVRQLLTEAVIVALMAGAIGIPLAAWGMRLIDSGIPAADGIPYYIDWELNSRVVLYTFVVSLVTGIVFGLFPALESTKSNLASSLREGGRNSGGSVRHNRLRSSLVVAEVALSLILLVGASLFVRSFMKLEAVSGGFDSSQLMTMRVYLPGTPYDSVGPKAQRMEDLIRRIEAIPGVASATASNSIALSGGGGGASLDLEGKPAVKGEEPGIFYTGVGGHWFKTLGVAMVRGRDMTDAEVADSSRVAVINEAMAKKLWPNEDALGRRFRFHGDTAAPWITIVGIARDFYNGDIDEDEAQPSAYMPLRYLVARNMGLTIRVAGGEPAAITPAVRREIRASDPKMPVFQVSTMEELRRLGFWQYKLFGAMFSVFGGIALVLAAIGVYGVISYSVTQRTQEIGVRMALGASRQNVLGLIIRQGMTLAVTGIVVGILGGLGVTRVVTSLLYGVSATDPLSFAVVSSFLAAVAIIASYVPARKAMGVDPMIAIRYE